MRQVIFPATLAADVEEVIPWRTRVQACTAVAAKSKRKRGGDTDVKTKAMMQYNYSEHDG